MKDTDYLNIHKSPEYKIKIFKILYLSVFILFLFRLFSVQILKGDVYRSKAENIAKRTTKILAQRGEIFDRSNTVPMVLNIDSFAVFITPAEMPSDIRDTVFIRLADLLQISKAQVERQIPPRLYKSYQPIEILSNVSYQTVTTLGERLDELPGVSWQLKPLRYFVDSGSISHIVGYVGDITKEELKILYNKGYSANSIIGKTGIEKQYDQILRGKDGLETKVVDVRGQNMLSPVGNYLVPPEPGKNIVLSLDRDMQFLAEKALGERSGSVIILKPATGEILSMVSWPWYDPNIFNKSTNSESVNIQDILKNPRKPFLNRAIQTHYPPASTFKILISTALLEEKTFLPDKTITCDGEIFYGDRLFRCWIRRPGHGPQTMLNALTNSCNIYYMIAGRDYLGIERINSYAKIFGFGELTNIDLPGEIPGFIPTPKWKERRYHEKWLLGDTMNTAIGQGFTLTTPLQLVNMVAMVVNEGIIYQPHLLKSVVDPSSNREVSVIKPVVLKKSNISKETFKEVKTQMRSVVTDGTARFPLNMKSVQIAAKTGTAEIGYNDRWHSWLVSYAPFDAPVEDQIAIVVLVEADNDWEWWSTYATAIIYQAIYANQSYDEAVDSLGLRYISTPQGRRE